MRISLAKLKSVAASRPAGYTEDVLASGTIKGDFLQLSAKAYTALLAKYRSSRTIAPVSKCCGPSVPRQIANAAQASMRLAKAVATGGKVQVSQDEQHRRFSICQTCEHFRHGRCKLCGCFTKLKTRLATEHCPANRW